MQAPQDGGPPSLPGRVAGSATMTPQNTDARPVPATHHGGPRSVVAKSNGRDGAHPSIREADGRDGARPSIAGLH